MSWIDNLGNNRFLRALYPQVDPALDAIRLHEVQLGQDGPIALLRFDLREYPALPPEKWRDAQGNTVQIRLMGIGVRELVIRGWTNNNIGNLSVRRGDSGKVVEFFAAGCQVAAAFDHLRVESVTTYWNDPGA